MVQENRFIEELQRQFAVTKPVITGIGDDGAVIAATGQATVVVTDLLLDGTHFSLDQTDPALIGRKAIAVNLSDLAAMTALPTAAFVSLALPTNLPEGMTHQHLLQRLYQGIGQLSERWGFTVAGGDTNLWDGKLGVNVCLLGCPLSDRIPLRSGGLPGDRLLVSGSLGGSLNSGRHLSFEPRLELSKWLSEHADVHAMMDISDGLATDLPRLLQASRCGARVGIAQIPIHTDVCQTRSEWDRQRAALCDGEDFELLLAVSGSDAERLLSGELPCPLTEIGELTAGHDLLFVHRDGTPITEPLQGWQHDLPSVQ